MTVAGLTDRFGRPVQHGMYKRPEYDTWKQMKQRCYNPKCQRYNRYGARGIKVCDRWRDSFEAFYADMGPRPSAAHSIERDDNNGDYEPGNCRWATKAEQNRNRGDNVILGHDGRSMTMAEWAREIGMGAKTLEYRIKGGWTIHDALTLPVEQRQWDPGDPIPTQKVEWKRKRDHSVFAINVLASMPEGEWIIPAAIVVGETSRKCGALIRLAFSGLVEKRPIRTTLRLTHYEYRITEAGRQKLRERLNREREGRPT
jgi:hypothetical protein